MLQRHSMVSKTTVLKARTLKLLGLIAEEVEPEATARATAAFRESLNPEAGKHNRSVQKASQAGH
eukprot:6919857-Alexandrium_andersonii.AAC.1